MTMVTSGEQGAFVAAMKQFGPVQTMRVPANPALWPPFCRWGAETQENLEPLSLWARHFLVSCKPDKCGVTEGDKHWRMDLREANLIGANLAGADLHEAFAGVFVDSVHFDRTHFDPGHYDVEGKLTTPTNLTGTNLRGADLRQTKGLTQAQLNTACLDGTTRLPKGLSLLSPSEHRDACQRWEEQ